MGAGVKLCYFLFICNFILIYSIECMNDEHTIEKRQITRDVEWSVDQPYLDGPNTKQINITKNAIIMEEEMKPPVIIAEFNYKGNGDIKFDFIYPPVGNTPLGLKWERQENRSIYLISTLKQDYEAGHRSYQLDVTISESSSLTKTQRLIIDILNIDDNPPVVLAPPCAVDELYLGLTNCTFTISDADGYISTSVMELRFIGSDVVNQSFTLENRVDKDAFGFNITLNVVKELDFYYHQMHIFDLVAYDSLPNNDSAQVIVRVNDVENMPPMWQTIFATETFDEKTFQTFTVRAIDGDTGINKPICYAIEKEFTDPVIEIDTTKGVIEVQPIDRDRLKKEVFRFDIIAYKCHNISWITPSTAVFVVNDINDQKPVIENTDVFEITIPEETYVSLDFSHIITIHDRDLGENARYSVMLESVSPVSAADAFIIIPRDGYQEQQFQISIMNASKLDFDKKGWETITLKIISVEGLDPLHTDSAVVTIHLENWNDELPIFDEEIYTADLEETAGVGEYVATVHATDRDVDDQIIYSLRGNSEQYLSIDPRSGEIRVLLNDSFDFDKQQEVVVQVEARDTLNIPPDNIHTVLTQLIINIQDVNNKPPQITMPIEPVSVEEHIINGNIISEGVIGNDVDTSAKITFSIDWDASYATKQGRRVGNPAHYVGCVDIETVYTPATSTRNAIGRIIAKQIGDRLNDTLDFELIEVLYLSIVLTDSETVVGANFTQGVLAINIIDINDNAPVWNEGTATKSYVVREEAPTNTVIDSVQATDADGPDFNVITYTIRARNGTGEDLVRINPDSGQLTVLKNEAISADDPPTYFLYYTLIASDCREQVQGVCHNTPIDIAIYIMDSNTKTPYHKTDDTLSYAVEIQEHSPEGSHVMKILGNDLDRDDPHNNVSYLIDYRTLPELERIFTISVHGGVITTKLPEYLERDYGVTRHTIPIQLVDNFYLEGDRTQRTNQTSIEVILLDINDNAPEFQPLNTPWTVSENTDQNVLVATIRAFDRDEEDTLRSQVEYEIKSVVSTDGNTEASHLFDIRTESVSDGTIYKFVGNIFTKTNLRSHWGTYDITIEARDMPNDEEIQRNSITHQINVEPFNFNEPTITYPGNEQIIRLSLEEAQLGRLRYASNNTLLHLAAAIDEDGGEAGQVSFQIKGNEEALQYFSIENVGNNEGQFLLDKEILQASRYMIHLVAMDHGQPQHTSEITFVFEVMSTDTMPQFLLPTYTTQFTELNAVPNERQDLPKAEDVLGEGRDNFYYIVDFVDMFELIKNTTMKVKDGVQLNRKEKDKYEIRYRVSIVEPGPSVNPRYDEMIIIVEVLEKDPKPIFELSQYTGSISVTDDVSKKITTVKAHHSLNLKIHYAIDLSTMVTDPSLENIKDRAFSIDSDTGDIHLQIKPTATMTGQFQFNVTATDTNETSSTAIVVVSILSSDNRITFSFMNTLESVEDKRAIISTIFSEEFEYQCTIYSIAISTDDDGVPITNKTDVITHFFDDGIVIDANIIAEKKGNTDFITNMMRRFLEYDLNLSDFLLNSNIPESLEKMLQIILIVVSTVLGTLCLLLVVAFCLKIRSLNKRLQALSVTKFGSQDSGLNRAGITVPGTNKHALEGSNPVWNEDVSAPSFDQLSTYSGDSDLIGIEDNPQFGYDNRGFEKKQNNIDY